MDFATIFEDCRKRYQGFDREIDRAKKPRSFEDAILEKSGEGVNPVIGEIKPASPMGKIREIGDASKVAKAIVDGGACGISVLTEERFFNGSLDNLKRVSDSVLLPVLRKDFIFDTSQVYESYYYGGDSLLIIASFLRTSELKALLGEARKLGMEPFVEIHSFKDIEKAREAKARLYIINNRDKDTLKIDLNRTRKFSDAINGIKISASGIENVKDLAFVLKYCDAALIGTAIMRASNIREKVREFVEP